MSRIRSIHPGFFTDEDFVQVSAFARLLLLGLGTEADDKGTFPWKPVSLKMRLFPMDMIDVPELLKELCEADAIRRYRAADGKEYGAIRNFREHQRPKKPNDIHPLPDELRTYVGLTDASGEPVGNQWGKTSADGGEGRGEEDGEEDGEESRGRGTRAGAQRKSLVPEDFIPEPSAGTQTAERMKVWTPQYHALQIEKFISHHRAKGNRYVDWQRAWTTWVLNGFDDGRTNGHGSTATGARGRNGTLNAALDAMAERRRAKPN